jgi:chromosome segregation ATPase
MKWQFAIAVQVALIHHSIARGLKGSSWVSEEKDGPFTQLEAETADLKKRNAHLEAMMQLARAEVQRMDAESRKQRHVNGGGSADAADQEIAALQKKLKEVQADKKQLVQTLRQMLAKNSTKIFQTQAQKAVKAHHDLKMECNNAQLACEAQIKAANGKGDETKEVAQTLQEQNMDLQRSVHDLRTKLAAMETNTVELATDKKNLVETMHTLMRENGEVKKELTAEIQKGTKEAQRLASDEAKLAKNSKKARQSAASTNIKKVAPPSKDAPMHLTHEESPAAQIAKLHKINEYIARAATPSDDTPDVSEEAPSQASPKDSDLTSVNKQVDQLSAQEDILARRKLSDYGLDSPQAVAAAAAVTRKSKGLSDYLGIPEPQAKVALTIPKDASGLSPIDALDPEAVKQEKAEEAKKTQADEDDGGDGIENLLAQAKGQLDAMDNAEAESSL